MGDSVRSYRGWLNFMENYPAQSMMEQILVYCTNCDEKTEHRLRQEPVGQKREIYECTGCSKVSPVEVLVKEIRSRRDGR